MMTALIISVIFTGLGIAYLGDVKRGIKLLALAVVLNILGMILHYIFSYMSILLWIYGLYATYVETQKTN